MRVIECYIAASSSSNSLLSEIKQIRHFEGDRMANTTMEGESEESQYQKISTDFFIKPEEIINKGFEGVMEKIQQMIEGTKQKLEKNLLKKITEITEKTGNVLSAEGKPLSHERYIQMLDKIEIDFEDNGEPILPGVICQPNMIPHLKAKYSEWESNPLFKEEFKNIIDKKRKEWHDRESNRKLVD